MKPLPIITDIDIVPACTCCRASGAIAKVDVIINDLPLRREILVIRDDEGRLRLLFNTRPDASGQLRLGLIPFDDDLRRALERPIFELLRNWGGLGTPSEGAI